MLSVFAIILFMNASGCNDNKDQKVAPSSKKIELSDAEQQAKDEAEKAKVAAAKKAEKAKKETAKIAKKTTKEIEKSIKKGELKGITISTSMGDMEAFLYTETPKHAENMIKLANEGYYDDLLFHRIIKGFMIQGGDPKSKGADAKARLGSGGPGYKVDAEFNPIYIHKKGAIAAARTGGSGNPKKESSGSQFYIVHGKKETLASLKQIEARINSNNPGLNFAYTPEQIEIYTTIGGTAMLDMDYTVYGEVYQGLDIIDKIAATKTAPGDRPLVDVTMKITAK